MLSKDSLWQDTVIWC